MARRSSSRFQLQQPERAREDFRDRSGDRSRHEVGDVARRPVEIRPVAASGPLVISIESTERLRQMLHTEKLTSESDLVVLVKDALALQYVRGVNEGVAQAGKDPLRLPSRSAEKVGRRDSWEQHRRAQQKSRLKNLLATVMILLMVGTAIVAITMFRPSLSADTVRLSEVSR